MLKTKRKRKLRKLSDGKREEKISSEGEEENAHPGNTI